MVLLIIIPMKNGYFIGNIPYFQTNPYGLPIESNHKNFSPTPWAKTLSRSTWSGTVQWGVRDSVGFWEPSPAAMARLLPQQPHTNEDLSIEVVGRVPQDALLQERKWDDYPVKSGQPASKVPDFAIEK